MPSIRRLGKSSDQRRAMLRGMVTLLLDKGRIETTLYRAKELKRVADKMITLGKKNNLAAKRAAMAYITKEAVVKKLFDQIAPSFDERKGGYTRILKLGPRRGDSAEMAIIELVNYVPKDKKDKKEKPEKSRKSKDDDKNTKDATKESKESKESKDTKAAKPEKTEEPIETETVETETETREAAEIKPEEPEEKPESESEPVEKNDETS